MSEEIEMNDNSFERFMAGADENPIIPSGLYMRVHWVQQLWLYTEYLANRSPENLEKVFSLFGEQDSLASLHVDQTAPIPFSGEWFSRVALGNNVRIDAGAILMAHGRISLADNSLIGQKAMLITVGHPIHPTQRHLQTRGPISIGKNVIVGADAVVVNSGRSDPTFIGEGSVILPGAIITKNIPPYSVVSGVNKILLQGEHYFAATRADKQPLLANRLSQEGLRQLPSDINPETDLSISFDRPATESMQIYQGSSPEERYSFFKGSDRFDLDTCVIHAPVYVEGEMPLIKNGMILNRGCHIETGEKGTLAFAKGTLLAPKATLSVGAQGTLSFEEVTWVGAGAEIVVQPEKSITVGYGSVLAAGARIVENIPPMSLVVGEGKIARQIDDRDISSVPPQWMDIPLYRQYHVVNMKTAQDMGPKGRQEFINRVREEIKDTRTPKEAKHNGPAAALR